MAEQENKTPKMDKKKSTLGSNPLKSKGKFNFYWIYGILAVIFIGLQFIGGNDTSKETNWGELRNMLQNEAVEKLSLVNKEIAEIYIKKDKLHEYTDKDSNNSTSTNFAGSSPDFYYQIGSVETFEQRVQEAQKNVSNPVYITNETRQDWGKDIFGWVIRIILWVVVW